MKAEYSCSLTSCRVQFFSDKNYKKDKRIRDNKSASTQTEASYFHMETLEEFF